MVSTSILMAAATDSLMLVVVLCFDCVGRVAADRPATLFQNTINWSWRLAGGGLLLSVVLREIEKFSQ